MPRDGRMLLRIKSGISRQPLSLPRKALGRLFFKTMELTPGWLEPRNGVNRESVIMTMTRLRSGRRGDVLMTFVSPWVLYLVLGTR